MNFVILSISNIHPSNYTWIISYLETFKHTNLSIKKWNTTLITIIVSLKRQHFPRFVSRIRDNAIRSKETILGRSSSKPLYTRCMYVSGCTSVHPGWIKIFSNDDDAAVVWPVFFGSRPNSPPGLDVYSVPRPAFLIDSINSSGAGRGKDRTDIYTNRLLEFLARGNRATGGSIGRSTDNRFCLRSASNIGE